MGERWSRAEAKAMASTVLVENAYFDGAIVRRGAHEVCASAREAHAVHDRSVAFEPFDSRTRLHVPHSSCLVRRGSVQLTISKMEWSNLTVDKMHNKKDYLPSRFQCKSRMAPECPRRIPRLTHSPKVLQTTVTQTLYN